jgi:hypothetical protein
MTENLAPFPVKDYLILESKIWILQNFQTTDYTYVESCEKDLFHTKKSVISKQRALSHRDSIIKINTVELCALSGSKPSQKKQRYRIKLRTFTL